MPLTTRESLLLRIRNLGDHAGWQEFFDRYWRLIYDVARKAGLSDAEAQDVVQETIIAVTKKMPNFRYDSARDSFRGWLLKITSWKIADQYRKRLPRRPPTETDRTRTVERIADPADFEALWDEQWRTHVLETALRNVRGRVKAPQFQMYYLHAVKGWPVAKVARRLDVNAGQIYLAKHRIGGMVKRETDRLRKGLQ